MTVTVRGRYTATYVWIAFTVEPLGDPGLTRKLIHNTVFALGTLALLLMASRAARGTRDAGAGGRRYRSSGGRCRSAH